MLEERGWFNKLAARVSLASFLFSLTLPKKEGCWKIASLALAHLLRATSARGTRVRCKCNSHARACATVRRARRPHPRSAPSPRPRPSRPDRHSLTGPCLHRTGSCATPHAGLELAMNVPCGPRERGAVAFAFHSPTSALAGLLDFWQRTHPMGLLLVAWLVASALAPGGCAASVLARGY